MRGFKEFVIVELKLFLREPEALFFTLVFPLVMLFVFGSIYGNEPSDFLGGRGSVDLSVPAYMALIISVSGLMGLPVSVATERDKRVLRRLRATPIRPRTILGAWVTVYFLITLASAVFLVVAGKLVYGLRFEGNALAVFLALALSTFSFLSLGFLIASLARTGRTASVVGMALFFPMIFFSGATIPWKVLPGGVQAVGWALPLTHVVKLLQGLWFGASWGECLVHVVILGAALVVGVAVSAKAFRWE